MKSFAAKRILLASGPTQAPLDDVRYIANRSSGRLGSAIAIELLARGARVQQLAGAGSLTATDLGKTGCPENYEMERYESVSDLKELLQSHLTQSGFDAVLMASAVLDYIPEQVEGKHGSSSDEWTVTFKRGEKLIEQIRTWARDCLLVGFKLESRISIDQLTERADDLMARSGARLVVANRAEDIDGERHTAYLVERDETGAAQRSGPYDSREHIASALADRMGELFSEGKV